ncbi:MAG: putative parallel beta-helix repeat, transcriptional regulator AraC, partial [SAR86 cluster bacterium SAR86B]
MNQTNDQWEIYLAETDSNSLESGGWISPSEFTKVFHGDVRFSSEYFGVTNQQHKQLIVELDTPFVRDPSKNLVIAVRDNEGGAQASSKRFELRNLGNNNYKTLVLGSNSPIDLDAVSGTAQSYHSSYVPWVIIEGISDSGIIYSSSTESNDAGILAPGETETYTATYTISQATFDSGGVSNSLTVSFENDDGDIISDVSDNDNDETNGGDTPTDDSFTQTPSAKVLKSVTVIDNGDTFDGLDDLLQYEIEIKNTGDVTLTNISLLDSLTDFAGEDLTLIDGPTYLFNGTKGIDASKIDRFKVGDNWFELVREKKTYLQAKALAQKRGGKLYRLKFTPVGDSTEKDVLIQQILDTLQYRQDDLSNTVITEDDPTAATPKNYLWINGEDIDQEGYWNHIDFDGTKVPWEDLMISFTAAQQDDENGVTMAENNLNEQDALGWALTEPYGWNDIDVDNELYYVIEYESNDIDWIGSGQTTLAPGESILYAAKFKINDQAVEAGGVKNTATATLTPPQGDPLVVQSDDPNNDADDDGNSVNDTDDSTDVELVYPSINVIKTIDKISRTVDGVTTDTIAQNEVIAGDKITFNIEVENTGNKPVVNLVVTDTITDSRAMHKVELTVTDDNIISDNGVAIDNTDADTANDYDGELGVGESLIYQIDYVIADSLSIVPIIINSAKVVGQTIVNEGEADEYILEPFDISDGDTAQVDGDDDGDFENDPTKVYLAPNPVIEAVKTISQIKKAPDFIDDVAQGDVNIGDKVFFDIVVTNKGNWPLVNIQAVDTITHSRGGAKDVLTDALQLESDAGVLITNTEPFDNVLSAGDSLVYKLEYVIPSTAAISPILSNSFEITADVETDYDGDGVMELYDTISDISHNGVTGSDTGDDPTDILMTPLPKLEVIKTVHEILRKDTDGIYTIQVNDSVQVEDKIIYHISAINNGNWPLRVDKFDTTDLSNPPSIRDTIVDSNGNNKLGLNPIIFEDAGVTVDENSFDGEIAAGDTIKYVVEYTILSSSSNAAFISNYAEVTAEIYKDGALFDTISDLSDDGDTTEGVDTGKDPTDVDLAPDPQLTVTKTVQEILRKDADDEYTVVVSDDNLEVDDLVKYTILVENTGNLPLTNLELIDSLYNLQNEFSLELNLEYDSATNPSVADWVENEVRTLIPGEIETYTTEHSIVQIDIDSGGILNSVFATASDPDDTEVNDVSDGDTDSEDGDGDLDFENDPTKTLISQSPLIEVTKTQRIREKD